MANNMDYSDIRKRMRENGFEEIQTVTAYYDDDTFPSWRRMNKLRYREKNFLLFAKPLGNIAILKICGTKYVYEIQNIGEHTLYDYYDIDEPPRYIQVNAKFINNSGMTLYFMIPHGL